MSQPSFTARNATNIAGLSSACLVLPIFKDRKLEGDIAEAGYQNVGGHHSGYSAG